MRAAVLFIVAALPAAAQTAEWLQAMKRAGSFEEAGDVPHAIASLHEAAKLAERDDATKALCLPPTLNRLGLNEELLGRYTDGMKAYRRALDLIETGGGKDSTDYATTMGNLAAAYVRSGDSVKAESLAREAIAIHVRAGSSNSDAAAVARSILAQSLIARDRWEEAAPLVEGELAVFEKRAGNPHLPMALNNLAVVRGVQGRHAEALALLERALVLMEQASGSQTPLMVEPLNNLATTYVNLGNLTEAENCYTRAISIAQSKHLTGSAAYPQILANYAEFLRRNGRKRESTHIKDLARDAAGESRRTNGVGMLVSASSLREGK